MSTLSDNLCKALEDVQSELKADHILEKLKKIVERQIREIKRSKEVELVLDEASSRIKSIPSFKEKLARKNYLKDWELNDESSREECQKAIREKLSDLIGIRINCFFKDDEELIYKYFIEKLEKLDQASRERLNTGRHLFLLPTGYKDDVKKLKTGDSLYKVSCEYRYKKAANSSQTCFIELQIKCMTHNLWGEVEHEISYKAKQYDYAFQSKNKQIQDIYTSLKASDSQLKTLYTSQAYREQDLINSLFFLYTQEEVKRDLNEKNPTQLYTWFFQLFQADEFLITDYVKNHWVPEHPFQKKTPEINRDNNILCYLVKNVILTHFKGAFNDISSIAKILYENIDEKNINWLIADALIRQISPQNTSDKLSGSSVLKELMEEDEEDNDIFPSEDAPLYRPRMYLKAQEVINTTIKTQVNTLLPVEVKNTLLQCVEILCRIISGGIQYV